MSSSFHLSRLRHSARLCPPTSLYSTHQPSLYSTVFTRRAMMSALRPPQQPHQHHVSRSPSPLPQTTPVALPEGTHLSNDAASPQIAARPPPAPKAEKPRPRIRSAKAALMITPTAVSRLRALLSGPTPQLIRIGVRNKGCAGLSYHLDYVDQPGKFDEVVEQDGVRVLIDSKALFSIIGSEMDWKEDALSAKFAFKNPNIKDACGCGESFTVGS
ncbi:Iron-sulfur assembly protein 1 [Leucoagaricus sp. SymC.cos]|nr:Iron-sulfur assembly protein 1 [Leucoagaricus sp. SymC.cos]